MIKYEISQNPYGVPQIHFFQILMPFVFSPTAIVLVMVSVVVSITDIVSERRLVT
jgi:hypothetical protein